MILEDKKLPGLATDFPVTLSDLAQPQAPFSVVVVAALCVACLLPLSFIHAGPISLPDAVRPGAVRPDTAGPDAVRPAVARPGAVRPDAAGPDADRPAVARPGAVQPGAVQPGTVAPTVAAPTVVPAPDGVEVPKMIDRPFAVDEGPYVQVREFNLIDFADLPQHGISMAEVRGIIAQQLAEQPARGFSIGELQLVADVVTSHYRGKGLILASATLPVQTVTEGVVDIQLLVGVLGRILVEGGSQYDEAVLRKPFSGLVGKPVTKAGIEKALLSITDFPGLSVYGVFQPGLRVGEADITLTIQEEKPFDISLRADSHGLRETGRYRPRIIVSWNNPTGGADRLTLSAQRAFEPNLSHYWSMEYQRYIGWGLTGGLSYFQNRFTVDPKRANNIQISSISQQAAAHMEYSAIRSRQENLSFRSSLTRKTSSVFLSGREENRADLSTLDLSLRYDLVDTLHPLRFLYDALFDIGEDFGGGLNFFELRAARGFPEFLGAMGCQRPDAIGPSRRKPDRSFTCGGFYKFFGSFSRLQLLSKNQSMLLRGEFQQTEDALTSLEQYSVGGPNNVRAYPEAQALYDNALFLSMDYIFNAPFIADKTALGNRTWGELLQVSAFFDYALGRLNFPLKTNRGATNLEEKGAWVPYGGYGVSVRFNIPGMIDSRVIWAHQTGEKQRTPTDNERREQLWAEFTYSF